MLDIVQFIFTIFFIWFSYKGYQTIKYILDLEEKERLEDKMK